METTIIESGTYLVTHVVIMMIWFLLNNASQLKFGPGPPVHSMYHSSEIRVVSTSVRRWETNLPTSHKKVSTIKDLRVSALSSTSDESPWPMIQMYEHLSIFSSNTAWCFVIHKCDELTGTSHAASSPTCLYQK